MINGLFLDPRTWKIDFISSTLWNPDRFGVHIDLHQDAFNIAKTGIDKKYKFVLTTEVWEIPLRKSLQKIREQGVKIFLIPRESIKFNNAAQGMFSFDKFFFNNEYYFTPDAVFALCDLYADLWNDKTNTYTTGYPRWDWCVDRSQWAPKEKICETYGMRKDAKIIFFPSFPAFAYKKINNKDTLVGILESRERIMEECIDFAKNNREYQFISKIHPMSMKCYIKNNSPLPDVCGLTENYYKRPTKYCKVFGDDRMSGLIIRNMLIASDIVVGLFSTTMLDATIINKPVIQAILDRKINMFDNPYTNMFETVLTKEDLKNSLVKFNNGKLGVSSVAVEKTNKYMQCLDKNVCERICSAIKKEVGAC